MARYEKEEKAATRLEAFEQEVTQRREALKAQLDAEKKELEQELEWEEDLEHERDLDELYSLKQYGVD